MAALLLATNRSLEDPELRMIISLSMEAPRLSPKSKDVSATPDDANLLNLPTPREPLRELTEQEIGPSVMIAAMEAMMPIVRTQPDFEVRRLARKTAVRFRY